MLRFAKWAAPVVAVGLMLAFTMTVKAENPKTATGTVSGTVVDKDGKAVSGAKVALFEPRHMRKHEDAKPEAAGAQTQHEKAAEARRAKHERPKPLFKATTDKDGKFSIANVPVGHYLAAAHLRGVGHVRKRIMVKAGKTTTLDLKLIPPKEHKPAAG